MAKYMISFPTGVMQVPDGEWDTVVRESHEVIEDMKAAGVYVFGGGLDDDVAAVRIAADGTETPGAYPQHAQFSGGHTIIEAATRDEAVQWAAKVAAACRCEQELRVFMYDPAS